MGRISSVVEIPDRRRRPTQRGGAYSPDRRYQRRDRTYSRSRSPLRNGSNRYRRASPDYSYPNLDEPRKSNERKNFDYDSRRKTYLDRDSRNGGRNVESESDEELKGLPYEEYRRLKRQKLRKMVRNNFWNCTPSPPRDPNEKSDGEIEEEEVGGDDEKQKKDGSKLKKSRAESESDSGSHSDDYRSKKRRKGKKSGSRRKSKRSKSVSESESESDDEDSGEERRRKSRKSRSRRKSRRSKSISESENEESGDDDSGEEMRSRKSSKRSSRRKRSSKKKSSSRKSESESGTEDSDNSDRVTSKKRKHRSSSSKGKKKIETSGGSMSADERAPDSEVVIQKLDEVNVDDESNIEFLKFKETIEQQRKITTLDDEPPVGPMPLPKAEGHISYGGALRPGEGDAIAQFVQQGKRIPRRGEVGLSADEISRYEDLGYVMSGSRHQRMNAIRIRKENQVYSAEDKRALAMFNYEEKAKREQKVMADLQRLVQRHIGEDTGPSHDPFGAGKATEETED